VHKDVPRRGVVVGLAKEVLEVVELAVDVSDEEDAGGSVYRWDVECGGLNVLTEVWLLQEEGKRGDAGEADVEEEDCEDGEGGHGAKRKAGCLTTRTSHGWYKYGPVSQSTFPMWRGDDQRKGRVGVHVTGTHFRWRCCDQSLFPSWSLSPKKLKRADADDQPPWDAYRCIHRSDAESMISRTGKHCRQRRGGSFCR